MAGHGILFKIFSSLGNYRNLLASRVTVAAYQQQNAGLRTETKEKLKQLKIPEAPKRPLTPYFRFLAQHRASVQKAHPEWNLLDIAKQCALDWKKVDLSLKESFKVEYDKDFETYELQQQKFTASLTKEQAEALKLAKQEKRASKERRSIRKVYRETHKPKRPISSFLFFVKEKMALPANKNKKLSDILKVVKEEWKTLSEKEKEKYVQLMDGDRQRYASEMKVWETQMVKEGRANIIRKDSQVITDKPSHLKKPTHKKSR